MVRLHLPYQQLIIVSYVTSQQTRCDLQHINQHISKTQNNGKNSNRVLTVCNMPDTVLGILPTFFSFENCSCLCK